LSVSYGKKVTVKSPLSGRPANGKTIHWETSACLLIIWKTAWKYGLLPITAYLSPPKTHKPSYRIPANKYLSSISRQKNWKEEDWFIRSVTSRTGGKAH